MRRWFLVLVVLLLLAGLVLATAAYAKGIEAGAPYGVEGLAWLCCGAMGR